MNTIEITENKLVFARGSLYRLLHRPNSQIDEVRRLKMALDVVSLGKLFWFHTYVVVCSVQLLILYYFRQKG
jgi:hypothetical protein